MTLIPKLEFLIAQLDFLLTLVPIGKAFLCDLCLVTSFIFFFFNLERKFALNVSARIEKFV